MALLFKLKIMIVIPLNYSQHRRIQITVCENPTPGTWGSHQLLLWEYRGLQEDDRWDQLHFNYDFLKDMEISYGALWCVYCGKEELRIYHWKEKPNYNDMATADHFIPKSKAPHLAKTRSNLKVCCWHCNNKKAAEEWPIKFPYD